MLPPIAAPWGKLQRLDGQVTAWHPLTHHCLDVAAVVLALLERTLLRRRLAALAGQEDLSPRQVRRLAWFAYLHDIGKLNAGFQRRAEAPSNAGHVAEAMGLFAGLRARSVSRSLRLEALTCWLGGDGEAARAMLAAAIAHHGRPLSPQGAGTREQAQWRPLGSYEPLAELETFLATGAAALAPDFDDASDPLFVTQPFTHAFAGLVMLADWIGSDEHFFPYSTSLEENRFPQARRFAQNALTEIGLDADSARAASPAADWLRAIGLAQPRPMQEALERLDLTDGPSIVLLESDTGSGKTEAAVAHFLRLFREGRVDGLSFALPTRAAAVQLHGRVEKALERALGENAPPVVLAVPGYAWPEKEKARPLPTEDALWPDRAADRHDARLWAAERPKRFLAAPVAVGTVDQVLLASLQVRHAHLRATALSRHLLVVDEVHASDAYMTALLGWVLDRLFEVGGHALLMSATLGSAARRRLLREEDADTLETAAGRPYPLISVHQHGRLDRVTCAHHGEPRTVSVTTVPAMATADAPDVVGRALDAARQGARVLIIRNTVTDALETQKALEQAAAAEPHLLFRCQGVAAPHHSRFARSDRRLLDKAVEDAFGRDADRDNGLVLVATQTVEQSLDIDADMLITDLCPMDVLLQRLGRVHRHSLSRPRGFESPAAVVLTPAERDLTPLATRGRGAFGIDGAGSPRAYPDLRVIEATWRLLESHPLLDLPAMNRRLVEEATHPDGLEAISSQLGEPWRQHARNIEGTRSAQRGVAGLNIVDWQEFYGRSPFPEDVKLATRLGGRDRTALFPAPPSSPFDPKTKLDLLTIPHWMAQDVPAEAEPEVLSADPLTFQLGPALFHYDRLGLQRLRNI